MLRRRFAILHAQEHANTRSTADLLRCWSAQVKHAKSDTRGHDQWWTNLWMNNTEDTWVMCVEGCSHGAKFSGLVQTKPDKAGIAARAGAQGATNPRHVASLRCVRPGKRGGRRGSVPIRLCRMIVSEQNYKCRITAAHWHSTTVFFSGGRITTKKQHHGRLVAAKRIGRL